jgi:hypothetical protein
MAGQQYKNFKDLFMKIGEPLLKILKKTYQPGELIRQGFGRYDLAFKTDEQGRPVLLFIGKADEYGVITGERFSRRLVFDASGKVLKDHWDNQGKI